MAILRTPLLSVIHLVILPGFFAAISIFPSRTFKRYTSKTVESRLLEATMELVDSDAVVGMQDMGAAGITCSTSEMSAAGKVGMEIDLTKVPTRQADMKDWEILLSESQERMLVVVEKGKEDVVKKIFDKWDLSCEEIGVVTKGDRVRYFMHGDLVGDVPCNDLVLGGGAPVYHREFQEPDYFKKWKFNLSPKKMNPAK